MKSEKDLKSYFIFVGILLDHLIILIIIFVFINSFIFNKLNKFKKHKLKKINIIYQHNNIDALKRLYNFSTSNSNYH